MGNPTVFPKLRGGDEVRTRLQDSVDITLRPLAQRVGVTPIMGAPLPAWVRPDQLLNGYSQTAAPQPICAYHIDALGYVHVKVGLTHAAGTAGGAIAFVMAKAAWPTETLTFFCSDQFGINSAMQVSISGELSNVAILAAGDEVRGYFTYRPGT